MTLRKVRFNKWIPRQYTTELPRTAISGTGCFETGYPNEGWFHQWASTYEEFENGAGNYTVALVELPDGTIESVLPINLKFEDTP